MNALLDTHVLLWWLDDHPSLSEAVAVTPAIHRDPFDRMLLAQASVEGFTIVSRDSVFERYKIPLIKA